MRIIALKAENIKKLIAVEIKPDGDIVEITGKNGQGKTSVLDSIWWALAGASNIQKTPIRTGAKTARIRLDLGELIVTRTFKAGKHGGTTSAMTVTSADGATFKSPQAMIDDLLGALSFDPLGFARMSTREQFDTLKKLAPNVNFDHIEEVNKAEFEKRAEINRKGKDVRARANAIATPATKPAKLVDEMELVRKMEDASEHNSKIGARKVRRETAAQDRVELEKAILDKVAEIEKKTAEGNAELEEIQTNYKELVKRINDAPELPAEIGVAGIREELEKAKITNADFRACADLDELTKQADTLEAESQALTDSMAVREEEKKKAVSEAKLPLKSLSFGNGEILMDGVAFDQASDAEQLRASVGIAMSLNPKLRVIRVRDGSLLDEDSMKLLAEMAKDNDYQVWVERVDGSGKVGFILEDGTVRKADAVPA